MKKSLNGQTVIEVGFLIKKLKVYTEIAHAINDNKIFQSLKPSHY